MNDKLVIEKIHCVDEGDRRPDGYLEYRYAYWHYVFDVSGCQLRARRYDDTPDLASIIARRSSPGDAWSRIGEIPYADPLFRAAVRHLVDHELVTTVNILSHGAYRPIDLRRVS